MKVLSIGTSNGISDKKMLHRDEIIIKITSKASSLNTISFTYCSTLLVFLWDMP